MSALPVRRLRHERGSSVFAYTSEIDAWREARTEEMDPSSPASGGEATAPRHEQTAAQTGWPRSRGLRLLGVVASLALIAAVSWLALSGIGQPADPDLNGSGALDADRSLVLFTRIDNRTGNPSLGGLVDAALEGEAGRSPHLAAVTRERLGEILQLMRQPRSVVVNRRVGRELCLREGGIRALVSSRIEKAGQGYLLSVDVAAPADGSLVFVESSEIRGQGSLASDLQSFSRRVIERLESEIESMEPALPSPARVTTASLDALQLYSRAEDLLDRGESSAAAELLQVAVGEDPVFASAYAQLSRAARMQGADESHCLSLAKTALDLSDSVSDRERLFIRGNYYRLSGDLREARSAYAALLTLDPDHYWGIRDAAEICDRLDTPETCLPYVVRIADMRPSDARANYEAARSQARIATDPARGDVYIERARDALTDESTLRDPETAALVRLFPIQKKWIDGDIEGLMQEETRITTSFDSWQPAVRDRVAEKMGRLLLSMGRGEEADGWLRRISDPSVRHEMLGWSLFARGDMPGLAEHLGRGTSYREPFTAVLLSATGHGGQAERLLSSLEAGGESPALLKIARGGLAMNQGDTSQAAASIRSGLQTLGASGESLYFAGSDMLAVMLREQGDVTAGLRLLEMTTEQKSDAAFLDDGIFWVKCQFRLAQMYREVGRLQDAREMEDALLRQLAIAEPGDPMRKELQRLQQTG